MRVIETMKLTRGDRVMVDYSAFVGAHQPAGNLFTPCQVGDRDSEGKWFVYPAKEELPGLYVAEDFIRRDVPAGGVTLL